MLENYKNIYVALDFSERSMAVYQKAVQIARLSGATLHLVCIIDTHSFGTMEAYDRKYAKELQAKAIVELEILKATAIEQGIVAVNSIVLEGVVKKILINFEDADLIIIGATGKGSLEVFILGSVSISVMRHAKCDVLFVR